MPLTDKTANTISVRGPDAVEAARRRLEVAFRSLTPQDRALVTLFEMEGWTVAELSRVYGKNEAAIKVRLSRARRKMRDAIVRRYHHQAVDVVVSPAESEGAVCVAVKSNED